MKYEVPYVVTWNARFDENGERTTEQASGVSSSKVGVKYRFYGSDQSGLALAVYPQVEFRTPGSKLEGEPDEGGEGGVAEEGVTYALPILLTKEFQRASITVNLGAERTTEDNHVDIAASFGVGTRLTDELAVMGEMAGQDLNRADEKRILLKVGFRLKISAKQAIVGSVGHDILNGADGQKHLYATLAYQLFFNTKSDSHENNSAGQVMHFGSRWMWLIRALAQRGSASPRGTGDDGRNGSGRPRGKDFSGDVAPRRDGIRHGRA